MRELLRNVRSITRGPASFTSPERLHFTTTSGTAAARMLDRCIAVTLGGCSPVRICLSRRRRRLRRRRALRGVQARAGRRAAFRSVGAVSTTVGAGARVAHPVQRVCSRARGGFCCSEWTARRAIKNIAIILTLSPAHGPFGWFCERGREMVVFRHGILENSTAQRVC